MKSVLFPGDSQTRTIETTTPTPGPGQVLIRLTASGVCGTDVHYWHESPDQRGERAAMTPGHEAVGHIAGLGEGVTGFREDDRVVVGLLHVGCGTCAACYEGEDALCPDKEVFGRTLHGSYAEYVVAPTRAVFHLPDDVSDGAAVVVACNLATGYAACERAGLRRGERVLVFGLGGVGLCAVLAASAAFGAEVLAIDPVEARRDHALTLGATEALSPEQLATRKDSDAGTGSVALECSGNPSAQRDALATLRPGGRLVVVGMGGMYEFVAEEVIGRKLTAMGSLVSRPQDFLSALKFARDHVSELESMVGPKLGIDHVDEAIDHMDQHAGGKVVFEWQPSEGAA